MTMFIQPSLGKASMALSENGVHPQKTLVGTMMSQWTGGYPLCYSCFLEWSESAQKTNPIKFLVWLRWNVWSGTPVMAFCQLFKYIMLETWKFKNASLLKSPLLFV
jgi:hypothetical protein